jgi:hypothetical protein
MPHPSDLDPEDHTSVFVNDSKGKLVCKETSLVTAASGPSEESRCNDGGQR